MEMEPEQKFNNFGSAILVQWALVHVLNVGESKVNFSPFLGPPPLSWATSPWSSCSQSCRGHQSRALACRMAFTERADTQSVPDNFCVSAGLERPRAVRSCGEECPAWVHSPWGPADCIAKNKGKRHRLMTARGPKPIRLSFSAKLFTMVRQVRVHKWDMIIQRRAGGKNSYLCIKLFVKLLFLDLEI